MSVIHSFPPLINQHCTTLILGSMPGKASLLAQQYYAHPRNLFWPLITELLKLPKHSDYHYRCEALLANQIAVWDVLKTCTRSSSLDSDIDADSIVPNDFVALLQSYPNVSQLYFNGAAAATIFRRHIQAKLPQRMEQVQLPSTSPANASIAYEQKLQAWQAIIDRPTRTFSDQIED